MRRSKKCEQGFHVNLTEEQLRGRTVSSNNWKCAGYAGSSLCECSCHGANKKSDRSTPAGRAK